MNSGAAKNVDKIEIFTLGRIIMIIIITVFEPFYWAFFYTHPPTLMNIAQYPMKQQQMRRVGVGIKNRGGGWVLLVLLFARMELNFSRFGLLINIFIAVLMMSTLCVYVFICSFGSA